jgi:5-methyltetrahydrofolate corrinoid/iron sulfur protein methyltransferase
LLLAADNIQGLNPAVAEAMEKLDPEPIKRLALRCQEAGADYIDINPGYLSKRKLDRMAFLVETIEAAVSLPVILDSPHPEILAKGLAACRKTPIINALSREERKVNEILPLAAEAKTRLVILLMDERSFTPPTLEEKIALAIELRELALLAGIKHEDLIFDPVLPNMSWDDAHLRISEGLKTVRLLSTGAIFEEPAATMVGLSNLRSGHAAFPPEVESTVLTLLAGAGLDIALANALRPNVREAREWIGRMVGRE